MTLNQQRQIGGAMTSATALRSIVGSGSRAQLLSGSARRAVTLHDGACVVNGHRPKLRESDHSRGWRKQRRRVVGCHGANTSDLVVKVTVKRFGTNAVRLWNTTMTHQRIY